jgi:hypothetical protein
MRLVEYMILAIALTGVQGSVIQYYGSSRIRERLYMACHHRTLPLTDEGFNYLSIDPI